MFKKYWHTPKEKGLTQKEIDTKVEELWLEHLSYSSNCPDCDVKTGENVLPQI